MYCTHCGSPRPDHATVCAQCGQPVAYATPAGLSPGQAVPNYLVQSILVTLCCCLPFGIPAIIYAAQVNGKLAAGDISGAMHASLRAKQWSWAAFIGGLLGGAVWAGLSLIGGLNGNR